MCVVNLAVTYSPLCDTDKTAYKEYLQAVKDALRACEGCASRGYVRRLVGSGGAAVGCGGKSIGESQDAESQWLGSSIGPSIDAGALDGACQSGRNREEVGVVFETYGTIDGGFSKVGAQSGAGRYTGGEERDVLCFEESDVKDRGKHWKKNQKKAQRKKESRRDRVNADAGPDLGFVSGSVSSFGINADAGFQNVGRSVQSSGSSGDDAGKILLRKSLEEKWRAENELKVARAKRELELLKAEDLDAVKKLRERKVQGATERTMVQIEKAHASLVQTGNVPGVRPVQSGFCQTVVDGEVVESVPGLSSGESKKCSISSSSSISEREVRNMMKELEDLREEVKKYRRKEGLGERVSKMYSESVPVTLDDEGCVPEDIKELAADRFEGHGFFKYGKVFEKDGKKYKTMKFDAEGYSYSGIENWYD